MSILSKINNNENLGSSSSFYEFRKQASFFLKEKIKTARLALTDVTPAQLLVEEATNANPWAPDARTLKMISKAAFEVDDYWRIVDILHKRFVRFDAKNWRVSYKSVVVLEYLLTQGPESVAEEFQSDKDVIQQMTNFQYIDEKGFNWGLNVRKKSERILKFLNEGDVLKEERAKARKVSRGIEGFGSFSGRTSAEHGILQQSCLERVKRSNSGFVGHGNFEEDQFSLTNQEGESNLEKPIKKKPENSSSYNPVGDHQIVVKLGTRRSLKENMAPEEDHAPIMEEINEEITTGESNPLLADQKKDSWVFVATEEEDHPFHDEENQAKKSLI